MGGEFNTCWQGLDISGAGILSLLFCGVSILFFSIAIGTDSWAVASPNPPQSPDSVNMGLWRYCTRVCMKYNDNTFLNSENNLGLVQETQCTAAMCIIADILCLVAIVWVVFSLGREGYGRLIKRAAACLYLGAFFGMVGMALWANLINNLPGFSPGFSFALEVTAWVLTLLAGVLLTVDSNNITYLDVRSAVRTGGPGMI